MKNILSFLIVIQFLMSTININNSNSQWLHTSNGITSTFGTTSFAVNGDNLFVGIGGGGVYLTTNDGVNWSAVNNGLTNNNISSLVVKGNNIYAGSLTGVFKSTNNGALWTWVFYNAIVTSLTTDGNMIYAGSEGYGVYISTNDGLNWSTNNNGLPDLNIKALSPFSNVYAATQSNGIFFTSNGGTWYPFNLGLTHYDISVLSTNPNSIFFAGTHSGLFRWEGGSTGWNAVNNGLNSLYIQSIASSGGNIFVGTNNSICVSTNYGANWIVKNEGFPSGLAINALVLTNNYIFAGTATQSVWRRSISEILTGVSQINTQVPSDYSLLQNYPNPFNPSTKIRFEIPKNEFVNLVVYDALGREITALVNETLQPGVYEADWDGSNYTSGIYYYRIKAGDFSDTKKFVLIK